MPFVSKIEIGINGLHCVPDYPLEGEKVLRELGGNAESAYYHADDGGEAAFAEFCEALEKYSIESYTGSFICQADPDGVIVKPKTFTANYKGEVIQAFHGSVSRPKRRSLTVRHI